MNTIDIWIAIGELLKAAFPGVNVYKERVKKLEAPAFSVELVERSTEVFGGLTRKRRYLFDIVYYSKTGALSENFAVEDRLTRSILPSLKVGPRWVAILEPVRSHYVDEDLHFFVPVSFTDGGTSFAYFKDPKTGEITAAESDTEVTDKRNIIRAVDLMRELYLNFEE